jgi:hypothetical protein
VSPLPPQTRESGQDDLPARHQFQANRFCALAVEQGIRRARVDDRKQVFGAAGPTKPTAKAGNTSAWSIPGTDRY